MGKAQATEAYMDLEEEYQRDEQYGGVEVVVVEQPTKRRRRIDEQTSEYAMRQCERTSRTIDSIMDTVVVVIGISIQAQIGI